jgi:hypothetical protein
MSRDLPARPNLDHLRKQAKTALRAMREHQADATLSDAQHAVAREYGFASWPKLKAHLEALPQGADDGAGRGGGGAAASDDAPQPPLFPRFTEASRRALFFSRYEAKDAGCLHIRSEHVLLGVIRGAGSATRALLERSAITLENARAVLAPNEPRYAIDEPVEIPFQPSARAVFTAAAREADRLGHAAIATIHIVLAILGADDAAASFLRARGMTLDSVRAAASADDAAAQDDRANS